VIEAKSPFGGAYAKFGGSFGGGYNRQGSYGASRFDQEPDQFASSYETPGWQRAKQQWKKGGGSTGRKPPPLQIEGELVASSSGTSAFAIGDRVFHDKFGYGHVAEVDGNKLTVDFDKAGQKRVVDSFVTRP